MMVKVTIAKGENFLSLRLEGHAGYAGIGKDIVCASCSILAYSVANIVMEEALKGSFSSEPEVRMESSFASIYCETTKDSHERLLHAFRTAEVGYRLLSHSYPQNVEFKIVGKPSEA